MLDTETKKACFDEITHELTDCDKKILVSDISRNWNQSFRNSETILLEWLKENENKLITKQYIIRGVDKKGNVFITIGSEETLSKIKSKLEQFVSTLYSLEISTDNRQISPATLSERFVINLPLKGAVRERKVQPLIIEPAQSTSANVKSSPFASVPKVKNEPSAKNVIKQEPKIKKESPQKSPQKTSPQKKDTSKKANATKVTNGKSLASFFSSKPVKNASEANKSKEGIFELNKSKEEEKVNLKKFIEEDRVTQIKSKEEEKSKLTKAKPKESPKNIKQEESNKKSGHKRKISNIIDTDDEEECIPATPKDIKKANKTSKKSSKTAAKRSKIQKMEDSSDEENSTKLTKEDESETQPMQPAEESTSYKRTKATRMVTKTCLDDEGYMITKKVAEEYSCSEDEIEESSTMDVLNEKPDNKEKQSNGKPSAKVVNKTPQPKANNKQKSILSFFGKK